MKAEHLNHIEEGIINSKKVISARTDSPLSPNFTSGSFRLHFESEKDLNDFLLDNYSFIVLELPLTDGALYGRLTGQHLQYLSGVLHSEIKKPL